MPRTTRYDTIGENETLSVELPNGIGVVHIRTAMVDVRSGNPAIVVEVNSDSLDTPAKDGRFYEERYDSMRSTITLIGYPPKNEEN